jgi:hypothetical protein
MFQPDYLQALIALGERDAREQEEEIRAFLVAGALAERRTPDRSLQGTKEGG